MEHYVVLRRRAGAAHSAGEGASADSLQLAKAAAKKKAAAAALAKEKEEAAQKKAAVVSTQQQPTPVPLVAGMPGVFKLSQP